MEQEKGLKLGQIYNLYAKIFAYPSWNELCADVEEIERERIKKAVKSIIKAARKMDQETADFVCNEN